MFFKSATPLITLMLCLLLHVPLPSLQAQGKKDLFLRKLSPLLKPTPFEKGSIGSLQSRLIRAMAVVEQSDRTYGLKPNELIERAISSHAHSGPKRSMLTAITIENAYEEAKYLGLYNNKGKFNLLIQNGPDSGKKALFEYIVPSDEAPEFSQDLANIRLVPPSKKRTSKTLSKSENLYLNKLELIKKEARNRLLLLEQDPNHLLDTSYSSVDKGPYLEKWNAAVETAEKATNIVPSIRLEAHKSAGASQSNGEKMSVWVKTHSEAQFPTKITVHCFMLGRTEKNKILFKVGESKKEVVLMPRDEQQMKFYSKSFTSLKGHAGDLDELPKKQRNQGKFEATGWVIRVEHNGKFVAGKSSMTILLPYADENFKGLKALP